MNKNKWILVIVILVVLIGASIFFFWKNMNSKNNSSYEANKTSHSEKIENNTSPENQTSSEDNPVSPENNNIPSDNQETTTVPVEEPIASFSTKIYSKDSARQNNIAITCQALNDTIVAKGASFSFCNTIGPASSSKGYQEADIFDNNGQKKKGLGGGNCQVSTTLYNAVLAVPSLVVTERHAHSNKVPYIQNGKDAAVAYGSYDFKFRNNTENSIKIRAEASSDTVSVTLIAMK